MSVSSQDNTYKSKAKREWRNFVYSLATPDNCSLLVDDDGKYQYKWLELVGDNALTFKQILETDRINENQLIGVDNRGDNIIKCKKLFPEAQFSSNNWNTFCRTYHENDIGVIVFDSWNAGYGNDFKSSLSATMSLALRCKESIGECLVVVNVDSQKTYRGYGKVRGMSSREVLKMSIESTFSNSDSYRLRTMDISVDSMYEYRQTKHSTKMLSCGILI